MRRTRNEWAEIVGRYKGSGLSMRGFCQSEGIIEQSLRNWVARISGGSDAAHGFVEVEAAIASDRHDVTETANDDAPVGRQGLTIRLCDGTGIEVHPDTDRSLLEWVLILLAMRK